MRYGLGALVLGAILMVSASAEAKHSKYRSRHPFKGGFCQIDVSHVHAYAPAEARLYRVVDSEYYFVGDPVPFGYDGPKHSYYGAHPVVEAEVHFGAPVYCYLDGAHFHWYAPPPAAQFEVRAGVNWYLGSFEAVFWDHRPRYVVINEVYRPIEYARPAVVVSDAPPGWHAVPPGHARARGRVVVAGPAPAPPPRLNVGIGIHFGTSPPPRTVVRERVIVVQPGHHKHHGHEKVKVKWKGEGKGKGHFGGKRKDD